MVSGGSSINQWKLILSIKNYLVKSIPKNLDDLIQKEISSLLKLSVNRHEDPVKKIEPQFIEFSKEKLSSDKVEKPSVSTLNSYIPLAQNFNKKPVKEVKIPAWMERKKNFVPKASVDNRTRYLLSNLGSLSGELVLKRVEDFCAHLKDYPTTKGVALKVSGIPKMLKISEICNNPYIKERAREALALLGYVAPVQGHGIRILSIDGGGIRGLVAINILLDIEKRAGQPIHKLFDYICGVSTGGIIAALIGSKFMPLEECHILYQDIANSIFSNTTIQKTARLVLNSSLYNGDDWSKILEKHVGSTPLIETARYEDMPKICIIAAHAGSEVIKPFLFRNYTLPHHVASHFEGSSSALMWQSVRASAAAPGYFNEFVVEDKFLLDGGVMVNNPTAIAVYEARRLWPDTKIQTVVSIGTGRHEPLISKPDSNVSWSTRFRAVVNSATDTEVVHATMHDLLPFGSYFRLNPYLGETITLDETRPDKILIMLEDTQMYIRKNDDKMSNVVNSLTRSKDFVNMACDFYNRKKLLWQAKL